MGLYQRVIKQSMKGYIQENLFFLYRKQPAINFVCYPQTIQKECHLVSKQDIYVSHCVILLNQYFTISNIKTTYIVKSIFCAKQYTICFAFSKMNTQFIIYKPITNMRKVFNWFSLYFFVFIQIKLSRSHLHIEISHNLQLNPYC